jgi:hypothetical protein
MVRSFALFVHLIGTVAVFAGFGLEWLANSDSIQPALRRLYAAGAGLIVLSGIFLTWREHGFELAWVRVSMGVLLLMGIVGGFRREGSLPLRAGMALAVLVVMIARPDLGGSLAVASVGISGGLIGSYWAGRFNRSGSL